MPENNVNIIQVEQKPIKCINCGGRVVPILYGEPNEEGGVLIDAKEMIMGGCIVSDNDPDWGCVDCKNKYIQSK